ncbi:hypothetical protein ACFCX4_19405 [Kitasatospora sp. NPDC056327]|uniref:hypothetical protein n=1 Tax=Kitasatospora sp. NPDC056327 TaxID=3345785 RepID=UPI0035D9043A
MRRLRAVAAVLAAAVLGAAALAPAGPADGGGDAGGSGSAAVAQRWPAGGGTGALGAMAGPGGLGGPGGPGGSGGFGGFGAAGRLRLLAGVLRQDRPGSGWYLVGGAHLVLNLTVESADHERIVLRFPPARRVVSVLCGPDETYAPLGYSCGASVSLDAVTVRLGRGGRPADPLATAAGPYANFWLLGLVEQR